MLVENTDANFPDELWVKIVACSNTKTKNALRKTCQQIKNLCTKNNLDIYKQSPLLLTQQQGEYALSYAAYKNSLSAVKNLLAHGARTRYTHGSIATSPKDIARQNHNREMLEALKLDAASAVGVAPSLYPLAAYLGDVELLKPYVLSDDYDPLYKNNNNKYSTGYSALLSIACQGQHTQVVELLLTNPKTIHAINKGDYRGTVANAAVFLSNAVILEKLLAIKSFKVRDDFCTHVLHRCAEYGYEECAKLVLAYEPQCINKKHDNMLNERVYTIEEYTPLVVACYYGQSGMVDILLQQKKVEVNKACSKAEITPLYAAVMQGHYSIVERLLQHPKIDPTIYTNNYTVLHCASEKGYMKIGLLLSMHRPKLLAMRTKDTNKLPHELISTS